MVANPQALLVISKNVPNQKPPQQNLLITTFQGLTLTAKLANL